MTNPPCPKCGKEYAIGGDSGTMYFYCECGKVGKSKGIRQSEKKNMTKTKTTKKIHKHLSTSEVYDTLRTMHSRLKDIYFMDNYKKYSAKQRKAIGLLDEALYRVEAFFVDF